MNKLDNSRVLLVLGGGDMEELSLDFRVMGLDDSHSRKTILRLTRLACRKTGIDTRGKRLSIEALQMEEGCYLLVTVKPRERRYLLRHSAELCYEFEDVEAFLSAVEAAYRQSFRASKNSAYESEGRYYLVFGYPALPKPLCRVLGEFGTRKRAALMGARLREQGRELCGRSAVEVIGGCLV